MNYWDLKVDALAGEKPKRIRRRGNIPPDVTIELKSNSSKDLTDVYTN